MNPLTGNEIQFLMECISHCCGAGYSSNKLIGHLQAKLSIMAEVKFLVGQHGEPIPRCWEEKKP